MKRIHSLLLGLGLIFLAWLVWKIGLRELWRQIAALGWGLSLIILAEILGLLAHTIGWRYCIEPGDGNVSLWRLFWMNMSGFAINYLTPTAYVGGDISRAGLLASQGKGAEAASSVVLDKLMSAFGHLLLVIFGAVFVYFLKVKLPAQLWAAMLATTVFLSLGMIVFLWMQRNGKIGALCRWLADRKLGGSFARGMADKVSQVDEILERFYREHPGRVVLSLFWHVVGHTAMIVQAWLFLRLLNEPVSWSMAVAAGSMSLWFDLLTFAVPMNMGTLEGSRILIFKALGCQALLGMAFGVAVRIAQLSAACLGLLSYAAFTVPANGRTDPARAAAK